ncbi:MAG: pantetheine-phosphate adenylyltransferase, partial [Thermoplasmata archaeon]
PRSLAPPAKARRARVAVLGGTFDHLHAGHRALLSGAFQRADEVKIGLTTDRFARAERKPLARRVQSYATRRRHLRAFLRERFGDRAWTVVPLNDRWGGSVGPGMDLLVLSEETRTAARPINAERRHHGLPPLRVYVVPQVRAEDGRPIASRRIRAGEIDGQGRLRPPSRRRRRASTKP